MLGREPVIALDKFKLIEVEIGVKQEGQVIQINIVSTGI